MAPTTQYYTETHDGQKIPVFFSDEEYAKFRTTEEKKNKNKEPVTPVQEEIASLPANTSDDADVKSRTTEDKDKDKIIADLRDAIDFLQDCRNADYMVHQSEIDPLEASLATAQAKITTLEQDVISPLQAKVAKLEEENKILLINLKAHQDAAMADLNKKSRELAAAKHNTTAHEGEGGTLERMVLVICGLVIAAIAMEVGLVLGGRGHRAVMEEWLSELGHTVERMVEAAVDHYHCTTGRQAVDVREL